jgi:hypothetical protein
MLDCTDLDAEALPRSRAEAVAVGAKRYFTGEPCANGHAAARYVSGACVDCVRDHNRRWEQANREKRRLRCAARYQQDREWWQEYHQNWKTQNPKSVKRTSREGRARLVARDAALAWARAAVASARQRARKRGVPFDLTPEYVRSLVTPECPALLVPLIYSAPTGGGPSRHSASLDCTDPASGYVPGNVRVVSHKANSIKNDATPEELMAVAVWAKQARAG